MPLPLRPFLTATLLLAGAVPFAIAQAPQPASPPASKPPPARGEVTGTITRFAGTELELSVPGSGPMALDLDDKGADVYRGDFRVGEDALKEGAEVRVTYQDDEDDPNVVRIDVLSPLTPWQPPRRP